MICAFCKRRSLEPLKHCSACRNRGGNAGMPGEGHAVPMVWVIIGCAMPQSAHGPHLAHGIVWYVWSGGIWDYFASVI